MIEISPKTHKSYIPQYDMLIISHDDPIYEFPSPSNTQVALTASPNFPDPPFESNTLKVPPLSLKPGTSTLGTAGKSNVAINTSWIVQHNTDLEPILKRGTPLRWMDVGGFGRQN